MNVLPAAGDPVRVVSLKRPAFWRVLQRRWRVFVVAFVSTAAVGATILSILPKTYTTDVRLIAGDANAAGPKVSDENQNPIAQAPSESHGPTAFTLAELARETTTAERVVDELKLPVDAKTLLTHVDITPLADTSIIAVRVRWSDPEMSATIANSFARAFVTQERTFVSSGAADVVDFLEREIPGARERMRQTRAALDAYASHTSLVDVTRQTQVAIDAAAEASSRIAKLNLDIRQTQAQLAALVRSDARAPGEIVGGASVTQNPIAQTLKAQQSQIALDLATALRTYTPQHPAVMRLRAQLTEVQRELARTPETIRSQTQIVPNPFAQQMESQRAALTAQIDGDGAQLAELVEQRRQLDAAVRHLPARQSRYAELSGDAKLAEDVYTALQHKHADALILKTTAFSDLTISEYARAAYATKSPDRTTALTLIVLLALLVAGAASTIADRLRARFANEADVLRELGLPLLAAIPQLAPGTSSVSGAIRSATIESFFQLVMALRYSSGLPLRTVAFTSPAARDGKSSIALNLALTLAEIEPRILIIDGDMRSPSLDKKLRTHNFHGLSDVLVGRAEVMHVIQSTPHPGLDLLTAGTKPPNPIALLQSERFKELLDELKRTYRTIIVDTAALEEVLDPFVVASITDGTVMVVARNRTHQLAAKRSLERLRATGARNIIGVVMNLKEIRPRTSMSYDNEMSSPLYLGNGVEMLSPDS